MKLNASIHGFEKLKTPAFILSCAFLVATMLLLAACNNDDPEKVNEGELITTVTIFLVPNGGGIPVALKFYDEDGETGNIKPTITSSGPLAANKTYAATIELLNEAASSPENITTEIEEEAEDHLFCYTVTNANVSITYQDSDDNNQPVGIETQWVTGAPGSGEVKVVLRHQPGEKNGNCPGAGDSDIEIDFDVIIQ